MTPKTQQKPSQFHLNPKEIERIVLAASSTRHSLRDRCIIKALYWLGLRRSEVANLDIPDIDFERKLVTVTGKGNKTRMIPIINDEFLADLKLLIADKRKGCVFESQKGKQISKRTINFLVDKLGKEAGVDNPRPRKSALNPHIFRHSIARLLKDKGFPIEYIQNILGHSSFKTTMDMYGTLSPDEMLKMAHRIMQ